MATDTIREAGRVVSEARDLGLRDLNADTLDRMRGQAGVERERIAAAIAEAGRRFSEARNAGRWGETEVAREQILLLHEDMADVEAQAARIEEAFQDRHLHEGVARRLGSDLRVRGLEAIILILIGAVLAIL